MKSTTDIGDRLQSELDAALRAEDILTDRRLSKFFLLVTLGFLIISVSDAIIIQSPLFLISNFICIVLDAVYFGFVLLVLLPGKNGKRAKRGGEGDKEGYYPRLRYWTFTVLVTVATLNQIGHGITHGTFAFSLKSVTTYTYLFILFLSVVYHDKKLTLFTGIYTIVSYNVIFLIGLFVEQMPIARAETIRVPEFSMDIWFYFITIVSLSTVVAMYAASRYRIMLTKSVQSKTSLSFMEEEHRKKTLFFTNLAHETKTPLILIDHYFNRYCEDYPGAPELDVIGRNIQKLKRDMIHFLDQEKLLSGKVFYNHKLGCHVSESLNEYLPLYRKLAAESNISIEANIDEDLAGQIDPVAFDQICNNLISNGIRYNRPNGHLMITLSRVGDTIQFIVEDTGIGIAEDVRHHLFDPYFQINHEKRNLQGLGLGLNIVKLILDQIGGKIHVESTLGEGSRFSVTFPLCRNVKSSETPDCYDKPGVCNAASPKNYLIDGTIKGRGSRILVVEDNEDLRNLLVSELGKDFEVNQAPNGVEAFRQLENGEVPELVLTDVMMDEMDGLELIYKVRNELDLKDIPVVFMTAKSSTEDRLEGLSLGAVDYITKPFGLDDLKLKIGNLLETRKIISSRVKKRLNDQLRKMLEDNSEAEQDPFEAQAARFGLSPQEKSIALQLLEGTGYKEIAADLNISVNTAKTYIRRLYGKCDINSKIELVKLFHRE